MTLFVVDMFFLVLYLRVFYLLSIYLRLLKHFFFCFPRIVLVIQAKTAFVSIFSTNFSLFFFYLSTFFIDVIPLYVTAIHFLQFPPSKVVTLCSFLGVCRVIPLLHERVAGDRAFACSQWTRLPLYQRACYRY